MLVNIGDEKGELLEPSSGRLTQTGEATRDAPHG